MDVTTRRPTRVELLDRLLLLVADHSGHQIDSLTPSSRLVRDLGIDSLDMIELMMSVEDTFRISLPSADEVNDPVYTSIFTKADFNISDFADLVFMQWETEPPIGPRKWWTQKSPLASTSHAPFSQLDGKHEPNDNSQLYTPLGRNDCGIESSRRNTDGMNCILIPGEDVTFRDGTKAVEDFFIDSEPVSTTAYVRFLNSISSIAAETESLWFALPEWDKRGIHLPIERNEDGEWNPRDGVETWPMMLVSWYGANAYALWANGEDWKSFHEESPFLPDTRQFEYAARGKEYSPFPNGTASPTPQEANLARLEFGRQYELTELPITAVNTLQGLSPFGLRHMVGNVWHWCRNWLDENKQVRAEKGGSWVGPVELGRCDFTRGRIPAAKGRCLGFRCARPQ